MIPETAILHLEFADPDDGFDPPADGFAICALPEGVDPDQAARRLEALHDGLAAHHEAWKEACDRWRAANPWPSTPPGAQATAHQRAALQAWFAAERTARRAAWIAVLGRPLSGGEEILVAATAPRPRPIRIRARRIFRAPPSLSDL